MVVTWNVDPESVYSSSSSVYSKCTVTQINVYQSVVGYTKSCCVKDVTN